MSSESSTLSSHSVVLSWLKDHADSPFPMADFTKAVSHDLQGSHVLLQHIGHIKPFWKHGLPSTHRRRHQLYVGDLRPRIAKDLKRVDRLIAFVHSEVRVFCSRASLLSPRDNSVTADLLKQLQVALQHLLDQIDSLTNDKPTNDKPTALVPDSDKLSSDKVSPDKVSPDKVSVDKVSASKLPQPKSQISQNSSALRRAYTTTIKPKKQVRFGGLQAQKIALIKPEQGPAIVTQCRHARGTCFQARCDCQDKIPSPISRADSAMSIR